jgi:hypothetical protein
MKLKSILSSALLLLAFAANSASALPCTLSASTSYVPLNAPFSYTIGISQIFTGPWYERELVGEGPFNVVFYGTKNGVADIPPSGENYPYTLGYGYSTLTGYANVASGGFSGSYQRYADIYDSTGAYYCTTNTISIVLQ